MLDFFPTPFPGEWWYSVLCRYYIMSGIKSSIRAKQMLFSNKAAQMASIFPNGTLAKVINQLPNSVFSFDDILENHTLFRYYMRFYSSSEQEYFRRCLKEGGNPLLTHVRSDYGQKEFAPRYCPMCMKEDEKLYGIPYYHTCHQIPMVTVCCKHGCKLHQIRQGEEYGKVSHRFRPLQFEKLDMNIEEGPEIERTVSVIARDYLMKPLSIGPNDGYNNLVQALVNKGYYRFTSRLGRTLDMSKIAGELNTLYGEQRVFEVFNGRLDNRYMRRLRHFELMRPDKYIMLQGLIGLSFDEFLSYGEINDPMLEKLKVIRDKNDLISIGQLANEMSLKTNEVRQLCKYYHIEPFWIEKYKCERFTNVVKKRISVTVTDEEYEIICKKARKYGLKSPGEYLVQVAIREDNKAH